MTVWTDIVVRETCGGQARGESWEASRVTIDSRRIKPGDLFVALKGERFDGHDFVQAAFDRSAAAAIVSRVPEGVSGPLVVVKDTLKALQELGAYARQRSFGHIVGLTGSVGKTSTKEMLRLALSAHGETFAGFGNYNNHIGVPLNLANLPPRCPYGVIEMGMNHKGEIAALTRLVNPHIAIVTGVDAVHMEFFDSVEAIADAKAEIFEGLVTGGVAMLNRDNYYFERLQRAAKQSSARHVVTCGEHPDSDCHLLHYRTHISGCVIKASIFGQEIEYGLGAIGRHWALASLFALGAVRLFKLDVEASARALAKFTEPEGRGRVQPLCVAGKDLLLIDDSYNASPVSMRAAFSKTAEVWVASGRKGRKVAVLGDMLELGKDAGTLHADLAVSLERYGFTGVFTVGQHMESLYNVLPSTIRAGHAGDAKALLPALIHGLKRDDVVLVKGSHGSKMYELVAALAEAAKEKQYAV